MRTKIALAPVVVGLVLDAGILHLGYIAAHPPTEGDCFGDAVCEASRQGGGGIHIAYVLLAALVLAICVAIG